MNTYQPGLHLLATFAAPVDRLTDAEACRTVFNRLITELELTRVGEVYHAFPDGGFTEVVCLTELHVWIHTWPEFGRATFDVFLSNYQRDNSDKVRTFLLRRHAGPLPVRNSPFRPLADDRFATYRRPTIV